MTPDLILPNSNLSMFKLVHFFLDCLFKYCQLMNKELGQEPQQGHPMPSKSRLVCKGGEKRAGRERW